MQSESRNCWNVGNVNARPKDFTDVILEDFVSMRPGLILFISLFAVASNDALYCLEVINWSDQWKFMRGPCWNKQYKSFVVTDLEPLKRQITKYGLSLCLDAVQIDVNFADALLMAARRNKFSST